MDTELVKTSKAQSSYIATSTTSFLSALEPALTTALEEVSMDYLTLDTACRIFFEQMESRIGITNFKSTTTCIYCSNLTGPKNQKYRRRAQVHHGGRCILCYRHYTRKFPAWLKKLDLPMEDLRKLSHGIASKDFAAIGEVFYGSVLNQGPIGRADRDMFESPLRPIPRWISPQDEHRYSEEEIDCDEFDDDESGGVV
jgi:hypothetical protein